MTLTADAVRVLAVKQRPGAGWGWGCAGLLFEVSPSDFSSLALPLAWLILAAALAALPAAARAVRIDPTVALRYE